MTNLYDLRVIQHFIHHISLTCNMYEVEVCKEELTSGVPSGWWGRRGQWAGGGIDNKLLGFACAVSHIKLIISTGYRDK